MPPSIECEPALLESREPSALDAAQLLDEVLDSFEAEVSALPEAEKPAPAAEVFVPSKPKKKKKSGEHQGSMTPAEAISETALLKDPDPHCLTAECSSAEDSPPLSKVDSDRTLLMEIAGTAVSPINEAPVAVDSDAGSDNLLPSVPPPRPPPHQMTAHPPDPAPSHPDLQPPIPEAPDLAKQPPDTSSPTLSPLTESLAVTSSTSSDLRSNGPRAPGRAAPDPPSPPAPRFKGHPTCRRLPAPHTAPPLPSPRSMRAPPPCLIRSRLPRPDPLPCCCPQSARPRHLSGSSWQCGGTRRRPQGPRRAPPQPRWSPLC